MTDYNAPLNAPMQPQYPPSPNGFQAPPPQPQYPGPYQNVPPQYPSPPQAPPQYNAGYVQPGIQVYVQPGFGVLPQIQCTCGYNGPPRMERHLASNKFCISCVVGLFIPIVGCIMCCVMKDDAPVCPNCNKINSPFNYCC